MYRKYIRLLYLIFFFCIFLCYWRASPLIVFQKAEHCAALLDCWKESYVKTRAYIESSGVGSRWEFDKNVIFGELDHIARICRDIAKVASTFISFEEIFNNNLRSITTHPEEVNNMIKKVIYIIHQQFFNRNINFLSPLFNSKEKNKLYKTNMPNYFLFYLKIQKRYIISFQI